jgi:hypothetical protein
MPESPPHPRPDMTPAWRAAALAYRQARGNGLGHHHAQAVAQAALHALHPVLTQKEASAEAVSAIAFASSYHAQWFWEPLRRRLAETAPEH